MHVVIGCGARAWNDARFVRLKLEVIEQDITRDDFLCVIEGGANGADRMIGKWAAAARKRGVGWVRFPAEWSEHHPDWCPGAWCAERRSCLGAGARRNQQMLDYALGADAQSLVAFKDGFDWKFKKGGTEDMVRRARAAGVHGKVFHHVEQQD